MNEQLLNLMKKNNDLKRFKKNKVFLLNEPTILKNDSFFTEIMIF